MMQRTRAAGQRPPAGQPQASLLGHWRQHAWRILAAPLLLLFTVPVVMMFAGATPQAILANLGQPAVLQALGVSLRTTFTSLAIILLLGTPLAYLMGRYQFRFKRLLDTLIDLPTVLPPSVAGVALLMTLGRRGLIGGWLAGLGIELAFSTAAVIIAQTFIAAPFYVRSATLGFAAIDLEIEQAAQLDGASRWQMFRYVILPLSRLALITGGMLSWARALGEFGATIIFAGNFPGRTQTMPTAIYLGFERDLDSALTLSAILVVISFACLLAIKLVVARQTDED